MSGAVAIDGVSPFGCRDQDHNLPVTLWGMFLEARLQVAAIEGFFMAEPMRILLLVAIRGEQLKRRMEQHLRAYQETDRERIALEFDWMPVDQVALRLTSHFERPEGNAAILLSDCLVEDAEERLPEHDVRTSVAKELFVRFGEQLFTSIAVMDPPEKVLDIDRTLASTCSFGQISRVLDRCADKLELLAKPATRTLRCDVSPRRIANRSELGKCFRLRHSVYVPMSYLERIVEEAPTGMDIDWFDTRSIQVGCFEHSSCRDLVGTARLITTRPLDREHRKWAGELAGTDPILGPRVDTGAIPALLPVFQSQPKLIAYLRAAHGKKTLLFGEVSRVVVDPSCRGSGLSRVLTECAISIAKDKGVVELFLECLPQHAGIYGKVGFKPMKGLCGKVYGVDRTMIVMSLPLRESVVS